MYKYVRSAACIHRILLRLRAVWLSHDEIDGIVVIGRATSSYGNMVVRYKPLQLRPASPKSSFTERTGGDLLIVVAEHFLL